VDIVGTLYYKHPTGRWGSNGTQLTPSWRKGEQEHADVNAVECDLQIGYRHVEFLVGSGAVETVCDPSAFPEYSVTPSDGSRAGTHYVSASGTRIPNLGEQRLVAATEEGMPCKIRIQSAKVSRPILSVRKLVESGREVHFDDKCGTIRNKKTGQSTTIRKRRGIYMLGMWLKTPN